MSKKRVILILGDQLSHEISSLKKADKENDVILMCENLNEAKYVKHHKKKLVFVFSAMRHFAKELMEKRFKVEYFELDFANKKGSFSHYVDKITKKYNAKELVVTFPGEYRVLQELKSLKKLGLDVEILEDDRFLCSISEFNEWSKGRKSLIMEYFYREMRKKYQILMDGKNSNKPKGGKWNFDSENRQKIPKDLKIPSKYHAKNDKITKDVIKMVEENFADHFGDVEPFYLAVDRKGALEARDDFIKNRLKNFGNYQDAMLQEDEFLFHSHIGFYLNIGLLNAMECIKKVEDEFNKGKIEINNAEGFIRQILGWREYVRGIYWMNMPKYEKENFLDAKNKLPDFFWDANTKMNCIKQCVKNTKENGYAHHIQRLMVLGNFALLAGIDPKYVNEWYLIVYVDAYQWVELPNVSGMILFADGGYLASKPYAASGSYINKMSNYCQNCEYKVKEKSGGDACPFNYLYWDFLDRNREKLKNNHRLAMIYRSLDRFNKEKIRQIRLDSRQFLQKNGVI